MFFQVIKEIAQLDNEVIDESKFEQLNLITISL